MKRSAFDDFSEGAMEAAYEAYDFKTCQRSDGTTYGTSGDCTQLGSKEVSKSSSKKKTSKKSSWDDSNLAGKMGTEIAKVAGSRGSTDDGWGPLGGTTPSVPRQNERELANEVIRLRNVAFRNPSKENMGNFMRALGAYNVEAGRRQLEEQGKSVDPWALQMLQDAYDPDGWLQR